MRVKIRHPNPATGVDYMIAVDRTEWVTIKVALEVCKEDFEESLNKGHVMTENQRGILALYTVMHATMEANTRACPDLPIQDQAIRTPSGGDTARLPTVQDWFRSRLFVRSQNRKDQDHN